jgi:predicted amidohydrolase YtcJ
MTQEIDDLIKELRETKNFGGFVKNTTTSPVISAAPEEEINEEDISRYIINKSTKVINQGITTIENVRDSVLDGGTPDEILAYSDLIKAVTSSLDTLNKINLQNKKDKTAKQLKEMDVKNQKQLEPNKIVTNNVIIAPREVLMKMLKDAEDKAKTIDIPSEQSSLPCE